MLLLYFLQSFRLSWFLLMWKNTLLPLARKTLMIPYHRWQFRFHRSWFNCLLIVVVVMMERYGWSLHCITMWKICFLVDDLEWMSKDSLQTHPFVMRLWHLGLSQTSPHTLSNSRGGPVSFRLSLVKFYFSPYLVWQFEPLNCSSMILALTIM